MKPRHSVMDLGKDSDMTKHISRRGFLKTSVAAAAPMVLPAGVLAANGNPGANDRIVIGAIGAGRQGGGLTTRFAGYEDVAIAAVADVDLRRAERLAGEVGADDVYQDYRRLLERDDIDAVVDAVPDHWRAIIGIHAAQAGKDIYGEKPVSLTIREGRQLVKAVRNNGAVYQTGTQRRSWQGNYDACMLVRNGRLGKIEKAIASDYPSPWRYGMAGEESVPAELNWDMWCGPVMPVPYHERGLFIQRGEPGWLSFEGFSGGELTGNGSHGLDQIQWALGTDDTGPVEVWTEGEPFEPPTYREPEGRGRGDARGVEPKVFMRYANGILIEFGDAPWGAGTIVGEKGSIAIGNNEFTTDPPELGEEPLDDPEIVMEHSEHHYRNWLDCIRDRRRAIADVEIGHRSVTICHLANIARWVSEVTGETGQRLEWDPVEERFTNSQWGNHFLDRPRRAGYELPEVE